MQRQHQTHIKMVRAAFMEKKSALRFDFYTRVEWPRRRDHETRISSSIVGFLLIQSLSMHFLDCTLAQHLFLMNQEMFNPIMVRRRSYRCNSSCVLFPLVVLSMLTTSTCLNATSDTLSKNESLSDGKTLISANRTFELGFFSPGTSSNRYVGIWYHRLPNTTVVWVANRNNPVIDKSGTLMFNDEGDLIVIDGRGSSSIIAHVSGAEGSQAILLDSGNLVLGSLNDSSEVLWQSFDYPTDTWLPGMKLGLSGRENKRLTSWKNEADPSSGDFSFGADPNDTLQLFIWRETQVYWTSGLWNGESFRTIPEIQQYRYYNFQFVSYSNEKYYNFSVNDDTVLSRFEIVISGQIKLLTWMENSKEWKLFWVQPRDSCDVYNACGAFGVCSNLSLPYCQCAKGFEPASPTDWDKGNTVGGCQRKTSLQCESGGENDGFLEMTDMKLPPNPQTLLNADRAEECKLACLNNCSCTAYALVKECYLWHGDLVDLHQFGNISIGKVGTIYLRLAASEFKSKGDKRKLLSIAIPVSLTALLFCSILCYLWITRQRHIGTKIYSDKLSLFASATTEATKLWWSEQDSQLALFDFSQIAEATNNFSAENKLGEGGFGPVYKGQTPEGENIAVKRLAVHSGQGLVEFKNEILLIAKLQHRNLVRLLGCCIQGEEKLLVYEYMPNKSLDFFLFDQTRRALLDWGMRFHIIEGIAQGLLYLHKHSRLKIIHRDLKASNILLDADMNPKISDFGMARIFGSNETQANTNKIVGTYGYISPEYAMEGIFSIKSDVYSFGVLLLEILSGTRNTGFHQHGNFLNLLSYGWDLWKEGRWFELMDQSLGEGCPRNEMLRCIHVALLCVQENAADRPTMSEVVAMLSSENTALPDPKQPPFHTVTITAVESDAIGNCSINVVTISAQDGR